MSVSSVISKTALAEPITLPDAKENEIPAKASPSEIQAILDRRDLPKRVSAFTEVLLEAFPKQFTETHQIEENECRKCEKEGSITSYEIGAGITLFGKSKKEWIEKEYVYAYHISPQRTLDEIVGDIKKLVFEGIPSMIVATHRLYLIGGDGSLDSNKLHNRIIDAVEMLYGSATNIVEKLIHPNLLRSTNTFNGKEYFYRPKIQNKLVSANIQVNGKITYCRHD
jgi:hypothetical protein